MYCCVVAKLITRAGFIVGQYGTLVYQYGVDYLQGEGLGLGLTHVALV